VGFLSCHTASIEQAAKRIEAAAVDQYFSSPTENISIPVCIRTLANKLTIFGDVLSMSQLGNNIHNSVTVTVKSTHRTRDEPLCILWIFTEIPAQHHNNIT